MAYGFVVRASSVETARAVASSNCGDEGAEVWLNTAVTSCAPLKQDGGLGVIMRDFLAG